MATVIPKQTKKERDQITIPWIATYCRLSSTIAGTRNPAATGSSTSA
jgi:hypothetical protein